MDIEIHKEYLEREKLILKLVAKKLGIKNIKGTPETHRVDGLFMCDKNDEIKFLIEAKSRNIKSKQYKTTKLELGKWIKLNEFDQYIPTILAIGWQDKIGFAQVSALEPEKYSLMNRRNIRRPSDWQIAVEIPVSQFTFIPYEVKKPKPKNDFPKPKI